MTDRIANALRRAHTSDLSNTTIDVFEPSTSFTQGEGWDVTYPDSADATYDARVDSPEATAERERSGMTAEIDAVVIVRDDTGQTWTGFGTETEASVRAKDTADGTLYEVESVVDPHNGTIELEVTEV